MHLHSALTRTLLFTNPTIGAASSDGTYMGTSATTVNFRIVNQEAGKITFGTNNTHRFEIDSNGRVGIGLPSSDSDLALATLDVRGDISGSGDFLGTGVGNRITNNGTPYLLSGDSPAETQTLQDVTTKGNITTTDIKAAHISGSDLTVSGNNNKFVEIVRTASSNPTNLNEFSSYSSLSIKNRDAGSFLNFGGNGEFSDIQATDGAASATAKGIVLNPYGGNVSIGTTGSEETLTVDGNIKIADTDKSIIGYSATESIRFYNPTNEIILSAATAIRFGTALRIAGNQIVENNDGDNYWQFYDQAYDGLGPPNH